MAFSHRASCLRQKKAISLSALLRSTHRCQPASVRIAFIAHRRRTMDTALTAPLGLNAPFLCNAARHRNCFRRAICPQVTQTYRTAASQPTISIQNSLYQRLCQCGNSPTASSPTARHARTITLTSALAASAAGAGAPCTSRSAALSTSPSIHLPIPNCLPQAPDCAPADWAERATPPVVASPCCLHPFSFFSPVHPPQKESEKK